LVAGRLQRTYAVAPGPEPVRPTQPGARPGDNPPPQTGSNPILIFGGAAALAGLGVYFFTRPGDAKQMAGTAEVAARDATHKAGEAVEALKHAGEEKFNELKGAAADQARALEAEAERLKAKGDRKWEEVKRQADAEYRSAKNESENLAQKAINDAKALVNQGEAKANEVKADVKAEANKKKGWFS